MAICVYCKKDMSDNNTKTCILNVIDFPDGTSLMQVSYKPDYGGPNQRCHDCNIEFGGVHHPGCDMERCPKCEGQLISCRCLDIDELT